MIYIYLVCSNIGHSVASDIETESKLISSFAENNSAVVTDFLPCLLLKRIFSCFYVQYDSFFWPASHSNLQLSPDVTQGTQRPIVFEFTNGNPGIINLKLHGAQLYGRKGMSNHLSLLHSYK